MDLTEALLGFLNDPANSDYQCGYLAALLDFEVRNPVLSPDQRHKP